MSYTPTQTHMQRKVHCKQTIKKVCVLWGGLIDFIKVMVTFLSLKAKQIVNSPICGF